MSRQGAFSGGASSPDFTMQCSPSLFELLDFRLPPMESEPLLTPLYRRMGPSDPWIAFPLNMTPDRTQSAESVLSRLACHWFVVQFSDADVMDLLDTCVRKWRVLHPQDSIDLSSQPSAVEGRVALTALVPRSDDPSDDLLVYKEKPDPKTVEWIKGLRKTK
jgi:hypothetical protein